MFYVMFILIMIASMAAIGLGVGSGGNQSTTVALIDDDLPEVTPFVQTFTAPLPTIDGTVPYMATIETNKGPIEIELATDAPAAVNNFAFLAGKGFYNGTTFFWVDDYFAQAGDPTCNLGEDAVCSGVGGPGYTLQVEDSGATHAQWSVVAIADRTGIVHGSQFRVLYQADTRLDGSETVFGTVTGGQDILEALEAFEPCSVVSSDICSEDLSLALVIESIVVRPI